MERRKATIALFVEEVPVPVVFLISRSGMGGEFEVGSPSTV
jgi:hypothetical protein